MSQVARFVFVIVFVIVFLLVRSCPLITLNVFVFLIVIVFVFAFVIVFLLAGSYLLIILIECCKGHNSLGSLHEGGL